MDKKALFKISYGLYVLTSKSKDKDNGCIVNTVLQVTDTPARIIVAVNKSNLTHDMIVESGVFNVSCLSENSKFETYKHWGFQSGRNTDKTESITYNRSENGLIYLTEEVNAYISAKVIEIKDLGTHSLFIADVTNAQILADEPSVTYSYYQSNIKVISKNETKKGWICTVCGYIYTGEELPDDFICPLCKHPASDFIKL